MASTPPATAFPALTAASPAAPTPLTTAPPAALTVPVTALATLWAAPTVFSTQLSAMLQAIFLTWSLRPTTMSATQSLERASMAALTSLVVTACGVRSSRAA